MEKYIDAEKLKAEIERRKQVHFDDYFIKKSGNPADYGASNALAQVLSFIDSLQQEQPSLPSNLDEAAEDFVWEIMENDEDGVSDLCRKLNYLNKITDFYDGLAEFFKAGAKWAMQQLKGE